MFEEFNNNRNQVAKKFMFPGLGFILLGVILYVLSLLEVAIVFALPGVVFIILGVVKIVRLTKDMKNKFLLELLNKHFNEVTFYPNRGASRDQVMESELLPRSDRFSSNDLIYAKYNSIDFMISDIHLQEVEHHGKNTTVRTIFRGPFMKFTFNKSFKGKLQVRERGFVNWFSKYKKIKLESIGFNKKFTTYSTEEHTAFYILTPHLMESLLELEANQKGSFYFSFVDGDMFIALDNRKDNFELPLFGKVDESIGEKFSKEFQIIKDIIDELKLNKNIFK